MCGCGDRRDVAGPDPLQSCEEIVDDPDIGDGQALRALRHGAKLFLEVRIVSICRHGWHPPCT